MARERGSPPSRRAGLGLLLTRKRTALSLFPLTLEPEIHPAYIGAPPATDHTAAGAVLYSGRTHAKKVTDDHPFLIWVGRRLLVYHANVLREDSIQEAGRREEGQSTLG